LGEVNIEAEIKEKTGSGFGLGLEVSREIHVSNTGLPDIISLCEYPKGKGGHRNIILLIAQTYATTMLQLQNQCVPFTKVVNP